MSLDIQKVLSELPEVLRQNPQLRYELFRILSENFSSREETNQLLRELRDLRKETARQFRELREENARQLRELREEMNARFAKVDERFARVDERFEALHREMDERFAKVDERFDALHREMHEGFAGLREEMQDIGKRVDLQVGRFLTRAGHNLEDLVAATLRVALQDRDIRPDSIRLRQKFVDEKGLVRPKGRALECDLLVRDGRILVFEIKAYAEMEDVEDLADKVKLVKSYHRGQEVVGVMVVLAAEEEIEEACRRRGIVLAR